MESMGMWERLRSVASWLLGLFRAAQDLFFLFTLFGSLGVGAIVIGILPELTDISSNSAILIGVGVALFSLPLLFPLVAWLLSLAGSRLPATVPVSEPEPQQIPPAPTEPAATGETLIGDTTTVEPYGAVDTEAIDYYSGRYDTRSRLTQLLRLKLGEIALLRRLVVGSPEHFVWQEVWRCQTALKAAGIVDPDSSIARLQQMGLIQRIGGNIGETDLGRELAWVFTQCMIHDPELVSAYRQVTPQINRTARFDGRPLS